MAGKKSWCIVDGYKPPKYKGGVSDYIGHECYMILNTSDKDAHCSINVYYMDRPPVKNIQYTAPAERISSFYSHDEGIFGGLGIDESVQYSLLITSDVDVVVQYGRMDINQDNLAYIATLGHGE